MSTSPGYQVEELAKQLSFEELLGDYLLSEENLSHWKARKERDKDVLEHKIVNEDRSKLTVEESRHEDSNIELEQLILPLGDYNLVSSERVRANFNKKYIRERILLKLANARMDLSRHQLQPIDENASMAELTEEIQRLRLELAEQRVQILEDAEKDFRESTSFTKYRNTEPQYVATK